MAVALALSFDTVDGNSHHLGPAEAFDGGVAHVAGAGAGAFRYLWYSVRRDSRPCPWCGFEVVDHGSGVAIMPDGEWRWCHALCAVAAKGGQSDIVPGAPWKRKKRGPCARCGAAFDAHGFWDHRRWCDVEGEQTYEDSLNG